MEGVEVALPTEDHGGEFVAIADYLNRAFEQLGDDDGIAVFLVQLTVQTVGQSYVPRFELLAKPNQWLMDVNADAIATVQGFLQACTAEFRPQATAILEGWSSRTGASMGINAKSVSVSLNWPYGADGLPRSLYVVYGNGLLVVNRGYLIEYGPFGSDDPGLDEALSRSFPTITDKPYYPSVSEPTPQAVAQFADWVAARVAASRETSRTAGTE